MAAVTHSLEKNPLGLFKPELFNRNGPNLAFETY